MISDYLYLFSFLWSFAAVVLFGMFPERVIPLNSVGLRPKEYDIVAHYVEDSIRMLAPPYLGYSILSFIGMLTESTNIKKIISSILCVVFLTNVLLELQWMYSGRWKRSTLSFYILLDLTVCLMNLTIVIGNL